MTIVPEETSARYILLAETNIYDAETEQIAPLTDLEAAMRAVEGLNGPDARREDFVWFEIRSPAAAIVLAWSALGVPTAQIVPPPWATESCYNQVEQDLQHIAVHAVGDFRVSMIRDVYLPERGPLEVTDDAVVTWTVEHASGVRPDEYEFTIRPDQIDELISALTMVKEAMA